MENLRIVVLDRGWVFIGNLSKTKKEYELTDTYCIRRWGTTTGLGQLAIAGKTAETILDPVGTVNFNNNALIHTIKVDKSKWGDLY